MSKTTLAVVEPQEVNEELQQKTDKKLLKRAEKIVRKLDNVLNDMNELTANSYDLATNDTVGTEVSEKDMDRFVELREVIQSSTSILFQLNNRMARKYAGKTIEPLGSRKRKALKA